MVPAISGFRRDVGGICALLGYYTASSCNPVPTFRDNIPSHLQGSTSRRLKMGPIGCPETSVKYHHLILRYIPVYRRPQLVLCSSGVTQHRTLSYAASRLVLKACLCHVNSELRLKCIWGISVNYSERNWHILVQRSYNATVAY
jgi:hypothetical protein